MACIIRGTLPPDLDEIAGIEKICFSLPHSREQLERELENGTFILLTALDDDMVAGYISMQYVVDEGYIGNVAVHPDFRRRGIADSLLDALIEEAGVLDLAFITLEVRQSNAPAVSLYEKHGFRSISVQKDYYTLPRENAIIMTLYL